jgi:hypothetical protein
MDKLTVGITGANSNLGKLIIEFLQQLEGSPRCVLLSSNPKRDQKMFDLEGETEFEVIDECDFLIHCARPIKPTDEKTERELEILERICSRETRILNISSVSGFLDVKNNYGIHKRVIHEWIEERGEINLVAGLIFGDRFEGQIFRMARILKRLPIRPQFRNEYEIYLTPVQQILVSIKDVLLRQNLESNFLIGKIPFTTNQLFRDISREGAMNLKLKSEEVRLLLNFLPPNRYFSSDSFLGLTGRYSELKTIQDSFLLDTIISDQWKHYISSLER